MNFIQILNRLQAYSLSLPYVNDANLGDIYEYLNGKPNVKYAAVNIDITQSTRNDNLTSYNVYLYYIDRLTQDKSNWMEVKTTAEQTLNSIINYAAKIGDVDDGWTINYFEQQFTDYCAGGYVQFNLEVPNEMGECLMDEYEEGEIVYPVFPEHKIIDDDVIAKDKTWSSFKINEIVTDLSTNINNCDDRISDLETTVNNLDTSVSDLNNRIETVEGELDNLGDFTCGTIEPTTTNFVEGTTYTIHESLQRTANLFEGYQGEIDDINDLIPNQATTQNQLADKAFVNSTVATNAANFRGNWSNWEDVPTDASYYPKDYVGSSTPTNNDYIVVQDASGFILQNEYVIIHRNNAGNVTIINKDGTSGEWIDAYPFSGRWIRYDDRMEFYQEAGGGYATRVRFSMNVAYNNVSYMAGTSIGLVQGTDMQFNYGVELDGQWRFIYVGDWTTNGRLGWKPQYQIGSSFTAEQQAAIDSTITANKVATYDGYGTKITALQTDKLDKNYTANKIYGTDSLGAQTVYTLGDGLTFDNGQIKCTRTTAAWGNITGTLSNQTDLQNALDSKQNTLTAGQNIDITDNIISAKGYLYDETKGAFATKFLKDEYDGGGIGTNNASGNYGSFAEGYNNTASGEYGSHAEGFLNTASGDSAHVEGQENTATHSSAHAEGRKTNATNNGAHSEGTYSDASGLASHAEGYGSTQYHNIASGDGSHAEGVCTRSQNKSEHAEGSSNVSHKASDTYGDAGNTQHSIGIGTHYNSTKNAVEVMQNGDMYILGVGGYQGTDTKVQNASIKTLQEYIASLEARIAALEGNTTVK